MLTAILLGFALTAHANACWFCTETTSTATDLQRNEQDIVSSTVDRLTQAVPAPQLTSSLERKNIKKRLEIFSNESKVSYIYLINYGRIMAFYTIKGKVTSGSKRLTSSQRKISIDCGQYCNETLAESPELDGTYGSSNPYIFFWTTDGTYVQWSGDYMLVDQPLQLTSQPELVRQVK